MSNKPIINIVSHSAKNDQITGPTKVFKNTCKGLELIGQPYVLNQKISNYSWNWIHDSHEALVETAVLGKPAVLGPNIVVLPKDLPKFRPRLNKKCIYLHPSEWAVNVWRQIGFTECRLMSWPAGIDTELFEVNRDNVVDDQVMIYFKERDPVLLELVIKNVNECGLVPHVIIYGKYNEDQYKKILSKCSFGIWLGRQESQGIALQEALSAGLPLIVVDAPSLFDTFAPKTYKFPYFLKSFRTTSAPYFDQRCGIIIDSIDDLNEAIEKVKHQMSFFDPKAFVREELSLEASAEKLVNIFSMLELDSPQEQKNIKPLQEEFSTSWETEIILNINKSLTIPKRAIRKINKILFGN